MIFEKETKTQFVALCSILEFRGAEYVESFCIMNQVES